MLKRRPWPLAAMIAGLIAPLLLPAAPVAAQSSQVKTAAPAQVDFMAQPASDPVRRVAAWVVASADNGGLAFVIVDKADAEVFVFDPRGRLIGASPALLGLARGDASAPGIGDRKLSQIRPGERTTPAGRFVASLGNDLGDKNVVWVDYDNAIAMHRVVRGNRNDHRLERLATTSPADNRITYGCINLPAKFYDSFIEPAFTGDDGIVYILPEVSALRDIFPGVELVNTPVVGVLEPAGSVRAK